MAPQVILADEKPDLEDSLQETPIKMPTLLTDINMDCLENIFKLLAFDQLLVIAHTSKEIKEAADLAFASNFGKTTFHLQINRESPTTCIKQSNIYIGDLKVALRLLRCFGHLITKVHIPFVLNHNDYKHVLLYMNNYCTSSLREFECTSWIDLFQYLKKPFEKVEKLQFNFGSAAGQTFIAKWDHLFMCFPNVRSLNINESFLPRTFLSAVQNMQQLQTLEITCKSLNDHQTIHLANLKKLRISFGKKRLQRIPFQCSQLEEFVLHGELSATDAPIIEFINKHSTITKLSLLPSEFGKNFGVDAEIIAKELPSLKEIHFGNSQISNNEATRLQEENMFLTKISYSTALYFDVHCIQSLLGNDWRVVCLPRVNHVLLLRKKIIS